MKLFVSYASQDQESREEIEDCLLDLDHTVWADKALKSGQEWWNEILEEIRRCEVFVTLISESYVRSEACGLELAYAVGLNKPILPIMVESVSNQLLSFELTKLQIMDYANLPPGKRITKMVKALRDIESSDGFPRPLPDPLPEAPEIPVSYKSRIYNRLQSDEELDVATQKAILDELRTAVRHNQGDHGEIRQLLEQMLRRGDEIRFNTAQDIKDLIQKIDTAASGARPKPPPSAPPPPPPGQGSGQSPGWSGQPPKAAAAMDEKLNLGLQILAFLIPLAGLVMFFMYRESARSKANRSMLLAVLGFFAYLLVEAMTVDTGMVYYGY